MPKSSKKSATKVDAAPAVVASTKSMKKCKREADEIVEKQVVITKKQKVVNGAIEKKKGDAKTQKKVVKKQKHNSSKESSPGEEEEKKAAVAPKKASHVVKNPVNEPISEESESSSDEEDAKLASASEKNGSVNAKKVEGSEDSSSDEEDVKAGPANKPAALAATKKADSDDKSSAESSSEDEEPQQKETKPYETKAASTPAAKFQEESSEDDASDEKPSKPQSVKKTVAKKEPKTTKKSTDVEMVDAPSAKKTPQTPATSQATGSKTLFMGNLSFSVEEADVVNFCKDAGEVVEVRFAMRDDRFAGYGHVEFATSEAAQEAVKLNGEELIGRAVKLDIAKERGAYTPSDGNERSFQKSGGQGQGLSIFVRGFGADDDFDSLKSTLEGHFGQCGEITRCSIPKDYETGCPKGVAFLDFADSNAFNKALELSGSDVGGGTITVEEAKPRGDRPPSSGGRSGGRSGGFGGRSGGGRFGNRDGGRGRFGSGGRGRVGGRGRSR